MNTSKESIIKIAESVCDSINFKELPIDASLTEAGFDSMDMASFVVELEETYGIKISDNDYAKLGSLADVIKYLESKSS